MLKLTFCRLRPLVPGPPSSCEVQGGFFVNEAWFLFSLLAGLSLSANSAWQAEDEVRDEPKAAPLVPPVAAPTEHVAGVLVERDV